MPDLEYMCASQDEAPPNGQGEQQTPEERSYFRVAAYLFVVGGVALGIGKVASSRLNPVDDVMRLAVLGALAIGVSIAGGYFGDRVMDYVRRTERRIKHQG